MMNRIEITKVPRKYNAWKFLVAIPIDVSVLLADAAYLYTTVVVKKAWITDYPVSATTLTTDEDRCLRSPERYSSHKFCLFHPSRDHHIQSAVVRSALEEGFAGTNGVMVGTSRKSTHANI